MMAAGAAEAKRQEDAMEKKCIMHYSNLQKILLVGEGDFSFSACLATAFGSAKNITATSLESLDAILKYKHGKENLVKLIKQGCTLIQEVDAISMSKHPCLIHLKFDRIVYNFPHAGFQYKREHDKHQISLHQAVVSGFFKSAQQMVTRNGQVHMIHKTSPPYSQWGIQKLAAESGLRLLKKSTFCINDYPDYNNKRGAGKNFDKSFPVGTCETFMFTLPDHTTIPSCGCVFCDKVIDDETFDEKNRRHCWACLLRGSEKQKSIVNVEIQKGLKISEQQIVQKMKRNYSYMDETNKNYLSDDEVAVTSVLETVKEAKRMKMRKKVHARILETKKEQMRVSAQMETHKQCNGIKVVKTRGINKCCRSQKLHKKLDTYKDEVKEMKVAPAEGTSDVVQELKFI